MQKHIDLVGNTNHQTQQIIIREDLAEDQVRDTLIHEILHIIWANTGMYERESMTQEETISGISPNLLGVLRDNQNLVSYLLSQ